MTAATRSALKLLLRGLAWALLAIATFAFWEGGRIISKFTKTGRIIAEMEGIGLALLTGALAFIAIIVANDLGAGEDSSRH